MVRETFFVPMFQPVLTIINVHENAPTDHAGDFFSKILRPYDCFQMGWASGGFWHIFLFVLSFSLPRSYVPIALTAEYCKIQSTWLARKSTPSLDNNILIA